MHERPVQVGLVGDVDLHNETIRDVLAGLASPYYERLSDLVEFHLWPEEIAEPELILFLHHGSYVIEPGGRPPSPDIRDRIESLAQAVPGIPIVTMRLFPVNADGQLLDDPEIDHPAVRRALMGGPSQWGYFQCVHEWLLDFARMMRGGSGDQGRS